MAWNEQGVLQFLNVQAARLLHLDAQASQGKNIADLVTLRRCCAAPSNTPAA